MKNDFFILKTILSEKIQAVCHFSAQSSLVIQDGGLHSWKVSAILLYDNCKVLLFL
jgi:hypothetical protein